jgi:hypothetical protein
VEDEENLRENEVNGGDVHSADISYRARESMIDLYETSISLFLSL